MSFSKAGKKTVRGEELTVQKALIKAQVTRELTEGTEREKRFFAVFVAIIISRARAN
jgi:hypothetical protein